MRIVRTFLGASRRGDRRPNPFTGFDPLDDVQMHELQPGLLRESDILDLQTFVRDVARRVAGEKAGRPRELVRRMCTRTIAPASSTTGCAIPTPTSRC